MATRQQIDQLSVNVEGFFNELHDLLELYIPHENIGGFIHKVVSRSVSVACDRADIENTVIAIERLILDQLRIKLEDIGDGRFEAKKTPEEKQRILKESNEQNCIVAKTILDEWSTFTTLFKRQLTVLAKQHDITDVKCYALKEIVNADIIILTLGYDEDEADENPQGDYEP